NPYYGKGLSDLLRDFRQRANAATEVSPDFDEKTVFGKVTRRLFLRRSPLKPAAYFVPLHM
ncbi:MAG TPA: hypothetical protein VGD41_17735, partial [Pyrinomonadaceae bacterium]